MSQNPICSNSGSVNSNAKSNRLSSSRGGSYSGAASAFFHLAFAPLFAYTAALAIGPVSG